MSVQLTKRDQEFLEKRGQLPLFDVQWEVIDYNHQNSESTQIRKKVTNQVIEVYDQEDEKRITIRERIQNIEEELQRLNDRYDKLDNELDKNPRMDTSEMLYISEQIQRLSREKKILTGWK